MLPEKLYCEVPSHTHTHTPPTFKGHIVLTSVYNTWLPFAKSTIGCEGSLILLM